MRLINKLKRLVGIDVTEYVIIYTDQLSQSQRMVLATKMINNIAFNQPSLKSQKRLLC